jgi:hypothetical protein
MDSACVATALAESITFAVKLDVPPVPGVPLMTPVEALRLSPVGREPEVIDQV